MKMLFRLKCWIIDNQQLGKPKENPFNLHSIIDSERSKWRQNGIKCHHYTFNAFSLLFEEESQLAWKHKGQKRLFTAPTSEASWKQDFIFLLNLLVC